MKTIFVKEDSRVLEVLIPVAAGVVVAAAAGLTMDHSICLKEVLVDLREDPDQCIMNPCNVT